MTTLDCARLPRWKIQTSSQHTFLIRKVLHPIETLSDPPSANLTFSQGLAAPEMFWVGRLAAGKTYYLGTFRTYKYGVGSVRSCFPDRTALPTACYFWVSNLIGWKPFLNLRCDKLHFGIQWVGRVSQYIVHAATRLLITTKNLAWHLLHKSSGLPPPYPLSQPAPQKLIRPHTIINVKVRIAQSFKEPT